VSTSTAALLADFSLEMTGKDVGELRAARSVVPAGTRVNVTYLGGEDLALRVAAAGAVRELGFRPVPHVSARRLGSREQLAEFLAALGAVGAGEELVVVGGDPGAPEGPYEDALAVIESGLLPSAGVRRVVLTGYPEGHPDIADVVLWQALEHKRSALQRQGLAGAVTTQFGFDADAVLRWVAALRARGIDLPVRVGVPGPAGARRLLRYAGRFGVATSAGIARKYGLSLTGLLGTAGPDRFLHDLAAGLDPARHGAVGVHFYTFGGLGATAAWVREFRAAG
jgi:methylenetetrahydrofolate reductase (NADPH)